MTLHDTIVKIRCAVLHSAIRSVFFAFSALPIKQNKVVFNSFFGKGYSGNPKSICDALLASGKPYDLVWEVSDTSAQVPRGVRKVKNKTLKWIYEMATARVWVDNSRKVEYVRKRKGQFYIQTWHGDIGLKKVEKDAEQALSPAYLKSAHNDSKMADLFVSGNSWMTARYREAFWYDGPIAKCGYPRRDILYSSPEQLSKLKAKIGLPENSKILFYAPTFRKNQEALGVSTFDLSWDAVLSAAGERFGGNWLGLIRLHPNISHMSSLLTLPENVLDMTNYPDMQELLAVSDICISDYSSSAFEFAVTGKPAFIYAGDLADYKADRDIYFRLEALPFSSALSQAQLISNIRRFDGADYARKHESFYRDTIGLYPEGHAAEYISKLIEQKCSV